MPLSFLPSPEEVIETFQQMPFELMPFPSRNQVLHSSYKHLQNILPLATIRHPDPRIKDQIHLVYVSFDPDITPWERRTDNFPEGDDIDNFSFLLDGEGRYIPEFKLTALDITESFKEDFEADQEALSKAMAKELNIRKCISLEGPDWFYEEDIPVNEFDEEFLFVCQLDTAGILHDDCRLFVFYDPDHRSVKIICQRK